MTVDDVMPIGSSPPAVARGSRWPPSYWLGVAVVLMVGGYLLAVRGSDQGALSQPRTEAVGFSRATFTGDVIRLADLRGQPVIVNFWASWCAPCRAEAPALERVWRAYRDRGVVVLGVDIQDTHAEARTFLDELRISYPNVRDDGDEIARAYQVTSIPATFFIGRDGRVVSRWFGPISQQQLVARLDELLR